MSHYSRTLWSINFYWYSAEDCFTLKTLLAFYPRGLIVNVSSPINFLTVDRLRRYLGEYVFLRSNP